MVSKTREPTVSNVSTSSCINIESTVQSTKQQSNQPSRCHSSHPLPLPTPLETSHPKRTTSQEREDGTKSSLATDTSTKYTRTSRISKYVLNRQLTPLSPKTFTTSPSFRAQLGVLEKYGMREERGWNCWDRYDCPVDECMRCRLGESADSRGGFLRKEKSLNGLTCCHHKWNVS